MKTLTLATFRGGAAKTTNALHLGIEAARTRKRVLLVDLDPQAHLTRCLVPDPPEGTVFLDQVLESRQAVPVPTAQPGLMVIPSRNKVSQVSESPLLSVRAWETLLARILEPLKADFDLCIIDTPATFGRLHTLAFRAADAYLIPLRPEAFSVLGFDDARVEVDKFKEELNLKNPEFIGYILSGVPKSVRRAVQQIREELAEDVRDRAIEIPHSIFVEEARWEGGATRSVYDLARAHELQDAYKEAFKKIWKWMGAK